MTPPRQEILPRTPSVRTLWLAVLFVVVGGAMAFSAMHPIYDWHVGAYVVASYERGGHGITRKQLASARSDLHTRRTAHDKRASAEDASFSRAFFRDTKITNEVLSFYRARVLFIQAARWLSIAIPGKLDRTFAVHALGTGLTALGVVLTIWLNRRFNLSWPLVLAATLFNLHVFEVAQVARYGHPDGAAFAFSIGLFLAYAGARAHWFYALCLIAPLVQSDLTVLTLLLVGAAGLSRKITRLHALALGLGSAAVHVTLAWLTNAPSWGVLAYHSFVARLTHPLTAPVSVDAAQYAAALVTMLRSARKDLPFLCWCALLVVLAVMGAFTRARLCSDPRVQLVVVSAVYVVVHLVAFPSISSRFFIAQYALCAAVLLALASERWPELALEQSEAAHSTPAHANS